MSTTFGIVSMNNAILKLQQHILWKGMALVVSTINSKADYYTAACDDGTVHGTSPLGTHEVSIIIIEVSLFWRLIYCNIQHWDFEKRPYYGGVLISEYPYH